MLTSGAGNSEIKSGNYQGSLWHRQIACEGPRPEILSWGFWGEPRKLPV